jgi:hypothetical protein
MQSIFHRRASMGLNLLLLLATLVCLNLTTASSSSNDDFTYSNPSDTYSPSQDVKYGHQLTNTDFAANMTYLTRVLYSPIVIFALGFLSLLALLFFLLLRCCSDGMKCLPDPSSETYNRGRLTNTVFFVAFCLLVVVIDQLVFLGNQHIDSGVSAFTDVIDSAQLIVDDVTGNATQLLGYGGTLTNNFEALNTSCSVASSSFGDVDSYLTTYNESIHTFQDLVSPIGGHFDTVTQYLDQYAGTYRTIALYIVWGLALVAVLFFAIGKLAASTCWLKFSITFGCLVYLLYLILGVPWVLTTSLTADLCMAPSYNVIKALPSSGSLRNMTMYFSSCEGVSPLSANVDTGISSLQQLNDTLATLMQSHVCPTNVEAAAMQTTTLRIIDHLEVLRDNTLACPRFQDLWFGVLNEALCTDLYTGIFYIWGSQLVTSFCLFVLLLIATYTHHYFDKKSAVGAAVQPGTEGDVYELENEDARPTHAVAVHGNNHNGHEAAAQVIEVDGHIELGKHI